MQCNTTNRNQPHIVAIPWLRLGYIASHNISHNAIICHAYHTPMFHIHQPRLHFTCKPTHTISSCCITHLRPHARKLPVTSTTAMASSVKTIAALLMAISVLLAVISTYVYTHYRCVYLFGFMHLYIYVSKQGVKLIDSTAACHYAFHVHSYRRHKPSWQKHLRANRHA